MTKPLDFDDFLRRARAVHGDRYDYSEAHAGWRGSQHPIPIRCPEHGPFVQRPNSHLQGQGCPRCATERSNAANWLPVEVVQQRVHDRYPHYVLDVATYQGVGKLAGWRCQRHDQAFQAVPARLVEGVLSALCPACRAEDFPGGTKKATPFDAFVRRAREVHGDRYDYTPAQAVWVHLSQKIPIVCPEHGTFVQDPQNHLHGVGCPRCAYRRSRAGSVMTSQAIERRVQASYPQYALETASYVRAGAPATWHCTDHGVTFETTPAALYGGHPSACCPICQEEMKRQRRQDSRADALADVQARLDLIRDCAGEHDTAIYQAWLTGQTNQQIGAQVGCTGEWVRQRLLVITKLLDAGGDQLSKRIGCRIRAARLQRQWSRPALAGRTRVLTAAALRDFENGVRRPTDGQAARLAQALGTVTAEWLLCCEEGNVAPGAAEPIVRSETPRPDPAEEEAEADPNQPQGTGPGAA